MLQDMMTNRKKYNIDDTEGDHKYPDEKHLKKSQILK
jgi:hypothetical protein